MVFWIGLVIVLVLAALAWKLGVGALRSMGQAAQAEAEEPAEVEDVADLAVFFVCRECGTEFQVTRLGETQVPRHCGERMDVVRRPAP